MYATVATWRWAPSLTDPDQRHRVVRELVARGIGSARTAGVVDVMMLAVEPDLLMAVSVFETLANADAARPGALQFMADAYGNTLTLVSRVTGQAYDPRQVAAGAQTVALPWRDDAEAMYASLVSWRLAPSIRSADGLARYLDELWDRYVPQLLQLGLVDALVVRTADDTILAVRLYARPVEGTEAYQEIVAVVQDLLVDKVAFLEKRTGRAFDIPQLLT